MDGLYSFTKLKSKLKSRVASANIPPPYNITTRGPRSHLTKDQNINNSGCKVIIRFLCINKNTKKKFCGQCLGSTRAWLWVALFFCVL